MIAFVYSVVKFFFLVGIASAVIGTVLGIIVFIRDAILAIARRKHV
jgi:uncharacterized membrane protein